MASVKSSRRYFVHLNGINSLPIPVDSIAQWVEWRCRNPKVWIRFSLETTIFRWLYKSVRQTVNNLACRLTNLGSKWRKGKGAHLTIKRRIKLTNKKAFSNQRFSRVRRGGRKNREVIVWVAMMWQDACERRVNSFIASKGRDTQVVWDSQLACPTYNKLHRWQLKRSTTQDLIHMGILPLRER